MVILFDESHNILESFSSIHTLSLDHADIREVVSRLDEYHKKYKMRLSVTSSYFINQVSHICKNIVKYMEKITESCEVNCYKLMGEIKCLEYDLQKIDAFIEKSEISSKLMMYYTNSANQGQQTEGSQQLAVASIETIFKFIRYIIEGARYDSVIFVSVLRESGGACRKTITYYPMDVSPFFNDIINRSHAVLFTGGTMKPMDYIKSVISESNKQAEYSVFPHVIDPNNITCCIVKSLTPEKRDIVFSHAHNEQSLDVNVGSTDLQARPPPLSHLFSHLVYHTVLSSEGRRSRVHCVLHVLQDDEHFQAYLSQAAHGSRWSPCSL